MKIPPSLSIPLLLALAGAASADVPKKAPLSRYTSLWTNSPFTSKPPPPEEGPEQNVLDDYALIGISPIENSGYRVTLINKKKPEDRITVDSGKIKEGFSIVGVERKAGDPLGTAVRMKSGNKVGVVRFDEKLLTLVKAPVVQQPNGLPPGQVRPPLPGQPGQPQQPQLQPGQAPTTGQQRQPRPRVVPPPTPQPAQGQPATQQQNQRPQRRGN